MPGDKSISHRALLVSALAEGSSRLRGLNEGRDVAATGAALRALGVALGSAESNDEVEVEGRGGMGLQEPVGVLDCGNSGTTMRMALGVCARVSGASVLVGDASLSRRPMLRVVAPLRQMGAVIDGREYGNHAPLFVRGGELDGIEHEMTVASAQVKSALLLAGMGASGTTTVIEPAPSRDHTERMLASCGVPIRRSDGAVALDGGVAPSPLELTVPGDISAAAFFLAAAACLPGSELTVTGVGLNPTRTGFLEVLRAMGAELDITETEEVTGEPCGSITVRAAPLRGVEIGADIVARLIDEIPILAVVATQAEGETVVRGAAELRLKESDRIDALVNGLRRLGVPVEALPDGLVVRGPAPLGGGRVESRGDHRIAMSFAVAGLVASEKVTVQGWSCVDTSFPGFSELLVRAQRR